MVWHLVLLTPRADLSTSDRRALVDAFERAVREIHSVRDVRVGRRFTHGAAYEALATDGPDFMVCVGFDDAAGLHAYLQHPAHEELGTRFYQSVRAGSAYDFEVEGVTGLTRLIE